MPMTAEDLAGLLEKAKKFSPDIVSSVLGLLSSIGNRDFFGMAVHATALVRQLAGTYDDGGRFLIRHVLRELAESMSDAMADELMSLESVNRTLPKVT